MFITKSLCMHSLLLISLLYVSTLYTQTESYEAVIVVPVADLVTEQLSLKYDDAEQAYAAIPVSWGPQLLDKLICPRQHQALYNEIVQVTETHEKEVCITLHNVISTATKNKQERIKFWTLKKNIAPLHTIPSVMQHYIPQPIDFRDPDLYQTNNNVITLTWPLHDTNTKKRYSAGTRFIGSTTVNNAYITYTYDHETSSLQKIIIPKRYACLGSPFSLQSRVTNFVKLLRDWTRSAGFIPLVWGGTSCAQRHTQEGFSLHYAKDFTGNKRAYWELHEKNSSPHSGFDASGLILRAAQICGIPYFFNNSADAALSMQHIQQNETVNEGDILWMPGGLLIVSDIQNNKIISALGYQYGFGKVVELSLSDLIENVSTYNDLMQAYKNQKPLYVKDNSGNVIKHVTEYLLLKLIPNPMGH